MVLILTSSLSDPKRNEFLKLNYTYKDYRKIRIIENLMVSSPFIIFTAFWELFVNKYYGGFTQLLIISAILMSFTNYKVIYTATIPTPFYKRPFEYIIGFRNTFYLILLAYILAFIAMKVGNFNLGIFTILMIFLINFSYFKEIEEENFVWIYSLNPLQFIIKKISTTYLHTFLLCIPILCILLLGSSQFIENLHIIILIFFLCFIYLTEVILAKYMFFSGEMTMGFSILFFLSFLFPAILFFTIPLFTKKSIKGLNRYL